MDFFQTTLNLAPDMFSGPGAALTALLESTIVISSMFGSIFTVPEVPLYVVLAPVTFQVPKFDRG